VKAFRGPWTKGFWLAGVLGLAWSSAPVRSQEFGTGNLLEQVIEGCPRTPDPEAYRAMERKVLIRLMEAMRLGQVRDALAAAEALESCRRRQVRTGDLDPANTPALLREIHCFLPLVLFEQQRQVDEGVARRALEVCPAPPGSPPGDGGERAVRRWGERVRRHLLLTAFVEEPSEVFRRAMDRVEALRQAGLWPEIALPGKEALREPEEAQTETGDTPGEQEEEQQGQMSCHGEDDGPSDSAGTGGIQDGEEFEGSSGIQNPLMTAWVLATVAAEAEGRVEDLARALGREEDLCYHPMLEGMALLQQMPALPTSALRLAQNRLLAPVVTGSVATLVEELGRRFEGRDCPSLGALALLALQALSREQVSALVNRGEAPRLAGLWRRVDARVPVTGASQDRLRILQAMADGPAFPGQDVRRCEWSEVLLEGRSPGEALKVLEKAGTGAECVRPLRVRAWAAIEADRGKEDPGGTAAIRAWLTPPPEPEEVLQFLQEVSPEEVQRHLVRRLGRHVLAADVLGTQRKPVIRALVKLVDKNPGTPLADAALSVVRKARGWAETPGEEVMLDLIATRHFLGAGRKAQAQAAYRSALARIRPSMEEAVQALWIVTIQLLRERQDGWVREGRTRLAALPPSEPMIATAAAVELARRGMRDLAIRVMRGATDRAKEQRRDPSTMAALADTWLLLNLPEEARKATAGEGTDDPENAPDLLRARQAMAEKDYRRAMGILGAILDRDPGNHDVRYQRALARMLAGRAEEAEVDLRVCLRASPTSPIVIGALAYAQFDQGHYEEAEQSFRKALAIDEEEPDNLLGLALTLFRLGRLEAAREVWTGHLKDHPLFRGGMEAAEAAGYSYSDFQKKAWQEFLEALSAPRRDGKPGR